MQAHARVDAATCIQVSGPVTGDSGPSSGLCAHASWLAAVLLGASGLGGCTRISDSKVPSDDVGLFTPGHRISTGTALLPATAVDGGAAGSGAAMSTAIPCMGNNLMVEDDGAMPGPCLTVTVTTDAPPGDFDRDGARDNNGAIWIEDEKGAHVAALERWAVKWPLQGSPTFLLTKSRLGCPDVIAGPTRHAHDAHMLVWKCQNTQDRVVPDGNYRLWVEVQIDEKHPLQAVSFPFTKGREAWMNSIPAQGVVQSATLKYTPLK